MHGPGGVNTVQSGRTWNAALLMHHVYGVKKEANLKRNEKLELLIYRLRNAWI